jgi:hypothetical protein
VAAHIADADMAVGWHAQQRAQPGLSAPPCPSLSRGVRRSRSCRPSVRRCWRARRGCATCCSSASA